ncbi:Aquaporin-9 [Geodia barretti]|uniref:Aquaporin-9 n=1 Tax=Geodia barretti TaxID=519541 RepID=A0AA35R252_GEOBA|nr:Aquaporin-9 [Geodia barretti]
MFDEMWAVNREQASEREKKSTTEGDSKPLLKYSADDYRGPPRGLRVGLAKVQKAGEVTTRGWARIVRIVRLREVFAEFLATFALLTFGNGSIAQAILSRDRGVEFIENGTTFFNPPLGTEMSINVGYGVGVMIGAYIAIGVTGGHMNPAVTLAMAIRGKTHWLKVIPYWVAQFLGAFFSSAVVYGTYIDALDSYTPCPKYSTPCTATIFATYPQPYLTLGRGVLDQVCIAITCTHLPCF